jgi:two-component system, response regulator YesN
MYKIVIVDDEKIICEGIKSKICRIENLEVDEVYTALNGQAALDLVDQVDPDIIITDIQMPLMNGIELIKKLSIEKPNIKSLVLSGYDDFEYVREAFRLGAVDYLLKPASVIELEEKIKVVIKKLKDERALKSSITDAFSKITNTLLEDKLNEIFNAGNTDSEVPDELEQFFSMSNFCLAIISFNDSAVLAGQNLLGSEFLENLKCKCLGSKELKVFTTKDFKDNLVFIFNFNKNCAYSDIINYLKQIQIELNNRLHCSFTIAISDFGSSINNLNNLYNQALHSLYYMLIRDSGNIIEYKSVSSLKAQFMLNKRELDSLEIVVKSKNMDELVSFIDKWFSKEKLSKQTIRNVEKLYELIIHKIMAFMSSEDLIYIEDNFRLLSSFNSLDEIKYYIKDYIFKVKQLTDQNLKREKSVIDIAKKYIEDNYSKNITMAEIANLVSMNYSYFSKLFKEETKMTFSSYLTMSRMEEAKRLLKDPINKISDISVKVGYDNAFHFSRAFKNYAGVSPNDFRK